MSYNMRKVIAALIVVITIAAWIITIFGIGEVNSIKDLLKLGLDIKGGVYVVMEAETDKTGEELSSLMEQTQAVIENRVNQMGLSEPVVTIEGDKRIRVELPGVDNAEEAIESIGRTAQLQFLLADGTIVCDGADIADAGVTQDSEHGGYAISLEFTSDGAKKFEEGTRRAMSGEITSMDPSMPGNVIMIVLDDEVISAPQVSSVIPNGEAVITSSRVGGFDQNEAMQTAALIRGGALPVGLTEVNSGTQTAKIGESAFEQSIVAGAIGLALIFIIMIIFYGIMGIAADVSLLLYVVIDLWIMVAMGSVLTLPGIAGIILSIGMAVDANVIIFSRIKEEIISGKSVRAAVESGSKRAIGTVLDSQITTIIAAIVLYQIGTSTVRGFALTLMIGIVTSIFTAVFVTQIYVKLLAGSRKFGTNKYFGVREDGTAKFSIKKEFDFIKYKKFYYLLAAVIIVAGLVVSAVSGMNYGIDFTGGTMIQLDFGEKVEEDAVYDVLKDYGIDDAEVIFASENNSEVIIRSMQALDNVERGELIEKLESEISAAEVLSSELFGPSVGKELRVNAVKAVIIAAACMLVYIIFRFEWKFGVASIVGVAHDVLMVIAFYAIFRVTVNNPFIAGILTVVGYSINDTIVVFDRIRENLGMMKKSDIDGVVNKSVNQTLMRSLMTSVTTLIVMIPLYIMAGSAIREFALPLMIGVIVGCISSVMLCSPLYRDLCVLTSGKKYRGAKAKTAK